MKNLSIPPNVNDTRLESGDIILQYLEYLGVEYVFGIPGGSIEPFYNALARRRRRGGTTTHILARHESGAAAMADGYARKTGKLGVCCATSGPGTTNMITGIACAYTNHTPMLVITAQTALPHFGRGSLQESSCDGVDTVAMLRYCTRYNSLVSHQDQLMPKLYKALNVALSDRPGPVHLSIPLDIMRQPFAPDQRNHWLPPNCHPDTHEAEPIRRLRELIDRANRGALVIGPDAAGAVANILALAMVKHWAVVATPGGKGLVSGDHPCFCGVLGLGGHQSAVAALSAARAELIVAVGVRLDETSTCGWDAETILSDRLVHVSRNPEFLLDSPMAKLQVLGSPAIIFRELLALVDNRPSHFAVDALAPGIRGVVYQDMSAAEDRDGPVKPPQLLRYLKRRIPGNTQLVMDAGNSFLWGIHYWDMGHGDALGEENLFAVDMGFCAMGWAIAAAIGYALGDKARPVVCVTGDGALLMVGQEMTVALQERLNILFIVLNDAALGTVKHGQRLARAETIAYQLPEVNFADMAKAMGVGSARIDRLEDLRSLDIDHILREPGPFLLDVVVDGEAVPPVQTRLKALGTLGEAPEGAN